MMNFWSRNKNKFNKYARYLTPLVFLLSYLVYPKTTYAVLPAVVYGGYALVGAIGTAVAAKYAAGAAKAGLLDGLVQGTAYVISRLATLILIIAKLIYNTSAILMNNIIAFSLSSESVNLDAISLTWGVIRDFANISLIFIILYISISTVLNLNGSNTYKMLGKLILVGLLINFSLVFTNLVIDTTNIAANQFLYAISDDGNIVESIGGALNIENVLRTVPSLEDSAQTTANHAIVMLGSSAFLLIAAFVLILGGGIFLVRIVKLMGIMIFSPLAFAAWILPKTEWLTNKWWGELTGNALVAPIYLFMVYVSLTVLVSILPPNMMAVSDIAGQLAMASSENIPKEPAIFQTILVLTLAIGLLTSASAFAAMASGETSKLGQAFATKALGTTIGAVAATGRQSFGRAGQFVSEKIQTGEDTKILGVGPSINLKNLNERTGGALKGTADYSRQSTFNIANAPAGIGASLEYAANTAGITTQGGLYFKDSKSAAGGFVKEKAEGTKKGEAEEKGLQGLDRTINTASIKERLRNDTNMTDKEIQDAFRQLRPSEKLELIGDDMSNPSKARLISNADKKTIDTLLGGQDETGQERIKTLIRANKDNNPGGYATIELKDKVGKVKKDVEEIQANIASGVAGAEENMRTLVDTIGDDVLEELDNNIKTSANFAKHLTEAQLPVVLKSVKNNAGRQSIGRAIQSNPANTSGNNFMATGPGRLIAPPQATPVVQAPAQQTPYEGRPARGAFARGVTSEPNTPGFYGS